MSTELWTPTFSLPYASAATLCQPYGSSPPAYATSATLTFRGAYRDIYGSSATLEFRGRDRRASVLDEDSFAVDISTDGGARWFNLLFWDEDHSPLGPGEQVVLDLTPFSGMTNLVLRFVYVALGWDWWAEVDDVDLKAFHSCSICGPPPGAFDLLYPPNEAMLTATDVTLDWADSAGADCYTLYFGTTDPPPLFDIYLPTSHRSVQNLSLNTWYYWRVDAVNSFGIVSASSGVWRFRTTGPANPKEVPEGSLRMEKAGTDVRVRWDATCGVADDYTLYEGDLALLSSGGQYSHRSLVCSDSGHDLQEVFSPSSGDRYYLIVPRTINGVEGSYGQGIPQGTDDAACGITAWIPSPCNPSGCMTNGAYYGYSITVPPTDPDWLVAPFAPLLQDGKIAGFRWLGVMYYGNIYAWPLFADHVYFDPANYIPLTPGVPFSHTFDLLWVDADGNPCLTTTYDISGTWDGCGYIHDGTVGYAAVASSLPACHDYLDAQGQFYFAWEAGIDESVVPGGRVVQEPVNRDLDEAYPDTASPKVDGCITSGADFGYSILTGEYDYLVAPFAPVLSDGKLAGFRWLGVTYYGSTYAWPLFAENIYFDPSEYVPLNAGVPFSVTFDHIWTSDGNECLTSTYTVSGIWDGCGYFYNTTIDYLGVASSLPVCNDFHDAEGNFHFNWESGIDASAMPMASMLRKPVSPHLGKDVPDAARRSIHRFYSSAASGAVGASCPVASAR
jgi:hypothetical protein